METPIISQEWLDNYYNQRMREEKSRAGKAGVAKRFKGKTDKQISQMMSRVRKEGYAKKQKEAEEQRIKDTLVQE